jgi:predicted HNH restriction endonuclease
MSLDNNQLKDIMKKNIYMLEKDGYGHMYIITSSFTISEYLKSQKMMIIDYIIKITKDALIASNNNNNKTTYVHLYLTNCTRKNFNLAWFKKINNIFCNTFEDALENMYIYSDSKLFVNLWKIIKNLIDKDTKKKIFLINC